MFKKFFSDLVTLIKNLTSHGSSFMTVGSDVVKLVALVSEKNIPGAVAYLVTLTSDVKAIPTNDIITQAEAVGVDVDAFKPLIAEVQNYIKAFDPAKLPVEVKAKADSVIAKIEEVIAKV